MEFISGSTLGPLEESTPIELRFWSAAGDDILKQTRRPESFTVLHVEPSNQTPDSIKTTTYNDFALTDHHDDAHHFALEYSQPQSSSLLNDLYQPLSSSSPSSISASRLILPNLQHIAIIPSSRASSSQFDNDNNVTSSPTGPSSAVLIPTHPSLSTFPHRPTTGNVLFKVGLDNQLADIDTTVRLGTVTVRGYTVFDHNAIQDISTNNQQQFLNHAREEAAAAAAAAAASANTSFSSNQIPPKSTQSFKPAKLLTNDTFSYGADVTWNRPTFSLGAKFNSDEYFVGLHALKSLSLRASSPVEQQVPGNGLSTIDSTIQKDGKNSISSISHILPAAIDLGMEYWYKWDDGMDTFSLSALSVWDRLAQTNARSTQGRLIPNTRHYRLNSSLSSSPSLSSPNNNNNNKSNNNNNNKNDHHFDIITPITPTSLNITVNGIGVLSTTYITNLFDSLSLSLFQPSHNHLSQRHYHDSQHHHSQEHDLHQITNSQKATSFVHRSCDFSSRVEYSIGAGESALHCGLQYLTHSFDTSYDPSHKSDPIVQPTSTTQHSLSLSSVDGIHYGYTSFLSHIPSLFSSLSSLTSASPTTSSFFANMAQSLPPATTPSSFYWHIGLSSFLPIQLTEEFFRLHHNFPILPELQQPFSEINALPCQQSAASLPQQPQQSSQQSDPYSSSQWYPSDYTFDTTSSHMLSQSTISQISTTDVHNQSFSTPTKMLPSSVSAAVSSSSSSSSTQPLSSPSPNDPSLLFSSGLPSHSFFSHSAVSSGANADPITRRLSLCSQNGEWKRLSRTGAYPSPVWNPFEGIRINAGIGFSM